MAEDKTKVGRGGGRRDEGEGLMRGRGSSGSEGKGLAKVKLLDCVAEGAQVPRDR